jgi:hypothetical protein
MVYGVDNPLRITSSGARAMRGSGTVSFVWSSGAPYPFVRGLEVPVDESPV